MVGGLAHGANDIPNAIGIYVVIYSVWYYNGNVLQNHPTPLWILLIGTFAMILGLAIWGYRVMKTIGEDLTKISPSRGFNVELGSALTVLVASRVGIPISTTHCKIGAVMGVGLADNRKAVNKRLFINIGVAWVITMPITAMMSSGSFLTLQYLKAF